LAHGKEKERKSLRAEKELEKDRGAELDNLFTWGRGL